MRKKLQGMAKITTCNFAGLSVNQILKMVFGIFAISFLTAPDGFSQEFASVNRAGQTSGPAINENSVQQQSKNQKSLIEVLSELSYTYKVSFDYEKEVLQEKYVDVGFAKKPGSTIEEHLSALLKPFGLSFEKLDEDYLIYPDPEKKTNTVKKLRSKFSGTEPEAGGNGLSNTNRIKIMKRDRANVEKTITGRVVSEEGEALPGVNVLEKGTTNGTVTDVEGRYTLSVSDGATTLIFSYVGYLAEEVEIGNRTTIDMTLQPDITSLSEVVVVGYGTQERARVTGAITTVSGENLKMQPVARVDQALQGQAAGVIVTNSGSPGTTPQVRIRGIGTINDNDPLYIIDGIPVAGNGAITNLNANDIESMEILKDASAAAIYGSRAANGVILITTKKGSRGKTTVTLDSYYGIQEAWRTLDLLNRDQYIQYGTTLQQNAGEAVPARFSDLGEFANVETDWQDEMFRTAAIQDHNVSVSGGNENAVFNVSGGYFQQDGIMLGTNFARYTFRANSEFNLGKVKVGETLTIAYTERKNETFSGGRSQLEHIIKSLPYIPVRDESRIGGFRAPDRIDGSDPENPVLNALLEENIDKGTKIFGTAYAEVPIIEGLKYKLLLGLDLSYDNFKNFTSIFDAGDFMNNPTADLAQGNTTFISPLISNQLSYNRTFGEHSIDAVAVFERQTFQRTFIRGAGENAQTSDIRVLDGVESPNVQGNEVDYALLSYVGRVNYDYAGKYLFSASIRRDGSSRFGPDNKWGTFPSVALGWRISEETFMDGVTWVSNLKLRASWGETGNDRIGDYRFQSTIDGNFNYNFNGGLQAASTITSLANADLKWETTEMLNIGLDVGLFDDRLTLALEYFDNDTEDMLLGVPIPFSLGFDGAPIANVGTVNNKGFEVTAGYRQSTGPVQWDVSGNMSFVTNELVSLGIGNTITGPAFEGDPVTFTEEGEPIAYFFGWVADGLFQSQAEIDAANALDGDASTPYQGTATSPGDIRFRDLDGNGVIDADDRTNIGHFLPDFTYGVTANATWNNFDLNIFLQGVSGNEILNTNIFDLEGMQRLFNAGTAVLNAWTPENPNTDVPRAVANDPNRNSRISTRYIEDGSYLRIKNLSLGYTFPESMLPAFFNGSVSRLRLYVTALNLATITDYEGYDPEIASRTGLNEVTASGVDYGQFPQARTFIGGIQISF